VDDHRRRRVAADARRIDRLIRPGQEHLPRARIEVHQLIRFAVERDVFLLETRRRRRAVLLQVLRFRVRLRGFRRGLCQIGRFLLMRRAQLRCDELLQHPGNLAGWPRFRTSLRRRVRRLRVDPALRCAERERRQQRVARVLRILRVLRQHVFRGQREFPDGRRVRLRQRPPLLFEREPDASRSCIVFRRFSAFFLIRRRDRRPRLPGADVLLLQPRATAASFTVPSGL
jgi:hypothetical protein